MPQIAKATKRALSKTKNVFRIAWDPIDPPLRLMSPLKQLCCFKKHLFDLQEKALENEPESTWHSYGQTEAFFEKKNPTVWDEFGFYKG